MSPEELEAIRERNAEPLSGSQTYVVEAADDRAALLEEVDRLRAELIQKDRDIAYLSRATVLLKVRQS